MEADYIRQTGQTGQKTAIQIHVPTGKIKARPLKAWSSLVAQHSLGLQYQDWEYVTFFLFLFLKAARNKGCTRETRNPRAPTGGLG